MRDAGRALGYRAQTDAIDAVLPARFVETIRPRPEAETRAPRGLVGRLLEPETAVKVALRLLDGTSLPGLRQLILVLEGKGARRSCNRAACPRLSEGLAG